MSLKNSFGKTSVLNISSIKKENKTILDNIYFTAPFKIMSPFYISDDYIKVMLLSVSAGIMEGDTQNIDIKIGDETKVEVISQSYEKIHKMKSGNASRCCNISVGKDAYLKYNPLPTIPFADSSFDSITKINLEDDSSRLIFNEIITCGRSAMGEKFLFNHYNSYLEVKKKCRLIYRDNTVYDKYLFNMSSIGMFEGYTHIANMIIVNFNKEDSFIEQARNIIDECDEVQGGVSTLQNNDIIIKILGTTSQKLINICEEITKLLEV
ncbi:MULTISPECIES: urease accessory protein UreD [Clostridium]|uniref:Urease accessory protein UreD n=2 Tax=Clostridium TaxID=1485 RepID=A0A1S9N642_CLOBE|nr:MULTISPECIES: urease accessory protein UreD [Clostridium]EKQ54859.1 MAG: urease accessory protein UreH [Clostridium sp. Maddingley MBC34-26]MZK51546.1 urease accessory protein UreD [Clostridium beijerinckii]MZK59821.1 urease accessory protein UreD [Clostridium beijerinckii]MZK70106.1 urease accessory protein UreD [Clostridium beijerinckii]MZK75349.1 urease accessory protein UreD [Clostridium beijerinckii]